MNLGRILSESMSLSSSLQWDDSTLCKDFRSNFINRAWPINPKVNSSKRRKDTVKSFYYGEGELKFSKIKLFSEWIDSKENIGSFDNDNE
jgi:hypothetical protein